MSASSSFAGAALVPGMPQLLARDGHDGWRELSEACLQIGHDIATIRPDAVMMLSTQWFTVLGHQFQMDPHPRGRHIDENWYDFEYGSLDYDFDVEVELTEQWALATEAAGFQARRTRYDDFPIDTGTIVAQAMTNQAKVPVALVSCNLYAKADDLAQIAAAGLRSAESSGKRVYFLAVSGLSSALTQEWITPELDRIATPDNEEWDRRMLELLGQGNLGQALEMREDYARAAQADSQFRALSFLAGTNELTGAADVLAYGPLWGTGGAVVRWAA